MLSSKKKLRFVLTRNVKISEMFHKWIDTPFSMMRSTILLTTWPQPAFRTTTLLVPLGNNLKQAWAFCTSRKSHAMNHPLLQHLCEIVWMHSGFTNRWEFESQMLFTLIYQSPVIFHQGLLLSLLFFLIIINNRHLLIAVNNLKIIYPPNDIDALVEDILKMRVLTATWDMNLNASKFFHRHQKPDATPNLHMPHSDGISLDKLNVQETSDLDTCWWQHIQILSPSGRINLKTPSDDGLVKTNACSPNNVGFNFNSFAFLCSQFDPALLVVRLGNLKYYYRQ